jgi:hypothetical protein
MHQDAWKQNPNKTRDCQIPYANQIVTIIIYLSDVQEGGETVFTDLDRKTGKHDGEKRTLAVKPQRGMHDTGVFPGLFT